MRLTTPVEIPTNLPEITHRHTVLLVGSCFATHMGERMRAAKLHCTINPHGVLYNPLSIATALNELVEGKTYTPDDLYPHDGLWHSPMHHGSFSTPDIDHTLRLINESLRTGREALLKADHLLLTFGTAWVYIDHTTGHVVGNCHKLPAQRFERRRLGVDEITTCIAYLFTRLFALRPSLRVLLTVSPVRHLRDGLHANQLSKATLLLAVDELCTRFPGQVFYFPAYELLTDELRDYRFYADDLTHPSTQAIDYVWEHFAQAMFSPETRALSDECIAIGRTLAHRPLHPDTLAYHRLLTDTIAKIERMQAQYPFLDFQNELDKCHTALTK